MPKTILAVDDSNSMRKMVSFTLEGAGYGVIEAVDGEDGLEKLKSNTIHLILTDQNMPKMDGLLMIKSVRLMPQYQELPILMLTTESTDEMKHQGRAAGATGWIVKPFDPAMLLKVVKKVIG